MNGAASQTIERRTKIKLLAVFSLDIRNTLVACKCDFALVNLSVALSRARKL